MSDKQSKVIAQSCEEFSINAYKNVASKKQNGFVFSPIGAQFVLSMSAYGADGNTKLQMTKGLMLPDEKSAGLKGFKTLIDELNNIPGIELVVSAKMFLSDVLNTKSEYVLVIQKYFSSTCDTISFLRKEESTNIINNWCSEATKNNIKQIITAADLDGNNAMLIINAVYFKAEWKYKFDHVNTKWEPFHSNEIKRKHLPFMYQENEFFCGVLEDIEATFIELPYMNEISRMVLIIPNEITGLSKVEQNLEKINHERLMACRNKIEIAIYLPKFHIESFVDLKTYLMNIGMTDMFSDIANFKKISDDNIKVVKVVQKSFIAIDEEGTIATAVTASQEELVSSTIPPSKVVRADRPFMAIIMCKETPLFYAKFTG